MGESPSTYIILGHGEETLVNFEDRDQIPPGYTLVTLSECGVYTSDNSVCPIIEAFTKEENKEILANPHLHKETVESFLGGKGIHIYTSGNRYPNLKIQLFADWNSDTTFHFVKSGTYKFPLNKDDFQIGEGATFCDRIRKDIPKRGFSFQPIIPADYSVEEMYKDSLMPTVSTVESIMGEAGIKRSQVKVKTRVTYNLKTIFETVGPGVYFYVICRNPSNITTPEQYINSTGPLENVVESYKPYFTPDWVAKIPNILPLLNKNMARYGPDTWSHKEAKRTKENYEKLQKIPIIRRKSLNQQSLLGEMARASGGSGSGGASHGGRRTRRKKQKRRKYSRHTKQK